MAGCGHQASRQDSQHPDQEERKEHNRQQARAVPQRKLRPFEYVIGHNTAAQCSRTEEPRRIKIEGRIISIASSSGQPAAQDVSRRSTRDDPGYLRSKIRISVRRVGKGYLWVRRVEFLWALAFHSPDPLWPSGPPNAGSPRRSFRRRFPRRNLRNSHEVKSASAPCSKRIARPSPKTLLACRSSWNHCKSSSRTTTPPISYRST